MHVIYLFVSLLQFFEEPQAGFISLAAYSRNIITGKHISYGLDDKLDQNIRTPILEAIRHISDHSCVSFEEFPQERFFNNDTNATTTGLSFQPSNDAHGCFAEENGLAFGQMVRIHLGNVCGTKLINCLRVILYALGVQYEHVRPDRNSYVHLNVSNLDQKFFHLFVRDQLFSSDEYKNVTPYDISSVMHFGPQEYNNNPDGKVFVAKNQLMQESIGNTLRLDSDLLSFRDKLTTNYLMHCNDHCQTQAYSNEPCIHGGYRNKLCKCLCPYGFSGDLCQLLKYHYRFNAPECGHLQLTDDLLDPEENSFFITSPSFPSQYPRNLFCQWYIEMDRPTEIIDITFNHLDLEHEEPPHSGDKCLDKLYIYAFGTDVVTNPLSCQPADEIKLIGQKFETQLNWLLIEFRTDPWGQFDHSGFNLTLQIIDTVREPSKVPIITDSETENAIRNYTDHLSNRIGEIKLSCYQCSNSSQCVKDKERTATCESKEACAFRIDENDLLHWRGCAHMDHCIKGWRDFLSTDRENVELFECCGIDYCNFHYDLTNFSSHNVIFGRLILILMAVTVIRLRFPLM